jgi:hypothetical protein
VLSDDKVIYLEQPKEYSKGDPRKYVFRPHKALYGLKQGTWSWYEMMQQALGELGFQQKESVLSDDKSLYAKAVRH